MDKEKIKTLIIEGHSVREVASICNCGESTVRRVVKEEDLKINSRRTKVTQEIIDKIEKLLNEGYTNKQIALELDMSPTTVRKYTNEALNRETNSIKTKTLTKKEINLTQEQWEVLYGSLLGDMSIDTNWKNARPIISQGGEQEAYFDYKCKIFEGLLGKPSKEDRYDKRTDKWYHKYHVKFLTNPIYTKLKEELYPNGVKTVTQKWLDKVTPRGLAFWFMDDGTNSGVIATNSFSKEECELIQKWFKEKWNINTTLQHQHNKDNIIQYLVYIKVDSRPKFYQLVIPYFIPEMEYKLRNWNP